MSSSSSEVDLKTASEAKEEAIQDVEKELDAIEATEAGGERGEWGNHCEFFLSSLGLAVGLGNIWRFPYICYENGGAIFLIPYLIMLVLVGLPMFFLEMSLGQYAGLSCTKIYSRMAPGLRGMGYGMITIPTIINFQYVVIMAYGMHFMFFGFRTELIWSHCRNDFNTDHCYSVQQANECVLGQEAFYMKECVNGTFFCANAPSPDPPMFFDETKEGYCQKFVSELNESSQVKFQDVTYRSSSSEEYWYKRVLNLDVVDGHVDTEVNSWSKWGGIRWEIVGCLALSWILICASLIQGVQSYGKVVYFTTLFPYVVLTTFIIYISTKDGFGNGVDYYIIPRDWSKIWDIKIWNEAAGQIFYSLGVAVGSQLLLSSYNGFRTNAHRDALLIGLCNSLTSLFAGFVVFGGLGYIAHEKKVGIEDVIESGPGLVFIVFPEVVAMMTPGPLFSFMFFLMLNLLAISSVCGGWEAFVASIFDEFPKLRKHRLWVMIISCFCAFLCGLAMCFDSGFFLFDLMNDRCSNAILLLAFIELVTVSWFYGSNNMLRHVKEMGMNIPAFMSWYWWACWTIITPILIGVVTILAWVNAAGDEFLDYVFPTWVSVIGWGLELVAVFILVIVSILTVIKRIRAGKTWAFLYAGPLMTPNKHWGPRPDSGLPTGNTGKDNDGFDDESEAAGVVSPHLPYAANTLVDNGIAMWNKFPALREASTKRMASNVAKSPDTMASPDSTETHPVAKPVDTEVEDASKPRHFKFPSHQGHMLSLAKMCKDSKQFSDCVIQCDGGEAVRAHRLVLGAASGFLKTVFKEVPASLPEANIVVPGVKESVVSSLLDFLYTGEMTIDRRDTMDLQLLIDTLQIDPQLISVDDETGDSSEEEAEETAGPKPSASAGKSDEAQDLSTASSRRRSISGDGEAIALQSPNYSLVAKSIALTADKNAPMPAHKPAGPSGGKLGTFSGDKTAPLPAHKLPGSSVEKPKGIPAESGGRSEEAEDLTISSSRKRSLSAEGGEEAPPLKMTKDSSIE
eukprot:maker-scaffold641_size121017-snap-gene-0.20 protein:Tk06983 transcript:maker-scaffold641_size121017-snap-gene-0.20-mRNA-1 annotation:"sodium- and chloride-dependent glycine transporter 2-like"